MFLLANITPQTPNPNTSQFKCPILHLLLLSCAVYGDMIKEQNINIKFEDF